MRRAVLAPEKDIGAKHHVPAVGARTTEQDLHSEELGISSIRNEIQLNRYISYLETATDQFLNESS
jgi:hypothetical protein